MDFRGSPEAARNTINSWVEQQTKNRIKDLLASGTITPETRLVITNAIYFKGFWESQFKKNSAKRRSIYTAGRHESHGTNDATDRIVRLLERGGFAGP